VTFPKCVSFVRALRVAAMSRPRRTVSGVWPEHCCGEGGIEFRLEEELDGEDERRTWQVVCHDSGTLEIDVWPISL
jgi:hypothetical protein